MAWFLLARKKDPKNPPVLKEKEESCFKDCLKCNCLKQDSERPEVPYLLLAFVVCCGLIYCVILILTHALRLLPYGLIIIIICFVILIGVYIKYKLIMKRIQIAAEAEPVVKETKRPELPPPKPKKKKVLNAHLMQPRQQVLDKSKTKKKRKNSERRLKKMLNADGLIVECNGAVGKVNPAYLASPLQEMGGAGVSSILSPEEYGRPRSLSLPSPYQYPIEIQDLPYPATLRVPKMRVSDNDRHHKDHNRHRRDHHYEHHRDNHRERSHSRRSSPHEPSVTIEVESSLIA